MVNGRKPGRPPAPTKRVDPKRVRESAESDAVLLDRLRKVRDNLTVRLDTAPDYAASGIAKVLNETLMQIELLEQPARPQPDTPLDEFTRRMRAKLDGNNHAG